MATIGRPFSADLFLVFVFTFIITTKQKNFLLPIFRIFLVNTVVSILLVFFTV